MEEAAVEYARITLGEENIILPLLASFPKTCYESISYIS